MHEKWLAGAALALVLAGPAWAQSAATAPAPAPRPAAAPDPDTEAAEAENEVDELVVVAGSRPVGAVISDIPPEEVLSPRDIRALGASTVSELLEALAPQLESTRGRGGGRPVTLVNGARISSFNEIRDLPPEAILRVEIFPEEVALQYGYRADQRVVNFVLRRRFRALTAEAGARVATAGGRAAFDADANTLQIMRDDRLQVDVKLGHSTPLLESERDLIARDAGRPFDAVGNVTASPFSSTAQIDPALSALAGRTVTVAPLPAGLNGAPRLADFLGAARTTDTGPFRTLLPEADQLALNAILTKPLGRGISATLNGTLEFNQSESRLGLATSTLVAPAGSPFSPFAGPVEVQRYVVGAGPLRRRGETLAGHLGLSLNGAVKGWRWTFTGNADRTQSESATDTGLNNLALQAAVLAGQVNPFAVAPGDLLYRAPDQAQSVVTSADADLLVSGTIKDLPAGPFTGSFTAGGETRHFESESLRAGVTRTSDLSRNLARVQANFDLPVASRRREVLTALGDLSFNLNLAVDHLSDFGDLTTIGGGVRWSPWEPLRIIASVTDENGAPTIQQLGDPEVATPAVRVFDFTRGETVEVTQISGGNRSLAADQRRVFKLGLNFKPFEEKDLNLRVDWTRSRTDGAISAFPAVSPEIEAAFPERFLRNAQGSLVQIDTRPVNFAREAREDVRWGFTYSRPIGRQGPPPGFQPGQGFQRGEGFQRGQGFQRGEGGGRRNRQDGAPAAGQPATPPTQGAAPATPPAEGQPPAARPRGDGGGFGARGVGGGRGGRGGFGGGGFGGGGGSFQLSLFHTHRLTDEVLIRPGVPVIDFLNGSAAGNGGGRSRDQVDLQAAVSRNGLGARLNARWQSGTEVRGSNGAGGQDLSFSDLTTVNLRLFADLGQRPFARRHPFFRGSRVALTLDNVFDARIDVRDALGVTPVNFQPDLLDPLGRTVRVSFRKLFF